MEASTTAKVVAYTVRGHWPFPTDMLRHDCSSAATSADQDKIDALTTDHAVDCNAFTDIELNLVGPHKPNTARWESFGWQVPSDTDHQQIKEWRKRARENDALFDAALAKLTTEERAIVLSRTKGVQ